MTINAYLVIVLLLPILGYVAGCFLVIYLAKRFTGNCKERDSALMIVYAGMLLGVAVLVAQLVYYLHQVQIAPL